MSDLSTTHWTALKKMMEDAGLVWVSKADAIEKLGRLGAVAPEVTEPVVTVTKVAMTSSCPTFDRHQPYGQICGEIEGAPGAYYMQRGLYFNSSGEVVGKV